MDEELPKCLPSDCSGLTIHEAAVNRALDGGVGFRRADT
jgi:hypothetical protein